MGGCVNLLASGECCVCVCVCDIKSEYQSTSVKQNTHQGPSGTKVPRLNMRRSMISLSKIAHQIWHDHLLSQIKQGNKKSSGGGVGLEATGKEGGWTKSEKVVFIK